MSTDIATFIASRNRSSVLPVEPRNVILHGDCLRILPQLAARSVDFVLTDPPYLVRYQGRDGRSVPNDDNYAWLTPAFAELYRVLAQTRSR